MTNASVVSIDSAERAALVDEFGELDRLTKQFAPTAARRDDLRKIIVGWAADLPTDQNTTYDGALYQVRVSECQEERNLDVKAKRKIFGILKLWRSMELFTITLKAVIAAPELGGEVLGELASYERTGPRHLVAVAIAPAATPAEQLAA